MHESKTTSVVVPQKTVGEAKKLVKRFWPNVKANNSGSVRILLHYAIERLNEEDGSELPLPDNMFLRIGT